MLSLAVTLLYRLIDCIDKPEMFRDNMNNSEDTGNFYYKTVLSVKIGGGKLS